MEFQRVMASFFLKKILVMKEITQKEAAMGRA